MHRTMTHTLRMLLQEYPNEWEEMVPYCECILRITPLKSLGGRSPYQVVTGLIPRLPRALLAEGPLGVLSPNEYVDRLTRYLKSCYDDIQRHQREIREDEEAAGRFPGGLSAELHVGDLVMIRLPPTQPRTGPSRFEPRCRDRLWKIYEKVSPGTFRLEGALDPQIKNPFLQNASSLIRIELPEIDIDENQRRVVEIYSDTSADWKRYRIERYAVDRRCLIKGMNRVPGTQDFEDEDFAEWHDLAIELHRWVI